MYADKYANYLKEIKEIMIRYFKFNHDYGYNIKTSVVNFKESDMIMFKIFFLKKNKD